MKKCRICGEIKDIEEFYNHKIAKDKKTSECRECIKKIVKARRIAFRSKVIEENRISYQNNKDKRKTKCAEYREKNRVKIKERQIKYRENNKQKIREYLKKWREENKVKLGLAKRNWYLSNKERLSDYYKNWAKENPHKANSCSQRRRARKKTTSVEKFNAVEIFERDGWVCQLCFKKVDKNRVFPDRLSASLDHIIPLSRGGEHRRQNVQLAHLGCNMKAGVGQIKQTKLF